MSTKHDLVVHDDTTQSRSLKKARVESSSSEEHHGDVQHTDSFVLERGASTLHNANNEQSFPSVHMNRSPMVESTDEEPPRASLLGLPREVRDSIYSYIFPSIVSLRRPGKTPRWLPATISGDSIVKRGSMFRVGGALISPAWWWLHMQKHRCAPLQVNRQIRDEIFPVFLRDGYIHSWERDAHMRATAAWLHNLPKEHFELIRAISVNHPRTWYLSTRLQSGIAAFPKSETTDITLYWFESDCYINTIRSVLSRHPEARSDGIQVELILRDAWKCWSKNDVQDRRTNTGGKVNQFDSDAYDEDDDDEEEEE